MDKPPRFMPAGLLWKWLGRQISIAQNVEDGRESARNWWELDLVLDVPKEEPVQRPEWRPIYGPATGLRLVQEQPCQTVIRRVGSAPVVGRRDHDRSSSSSTGPTGPSPVAASAAAATSASSMRSSEMTSALKASTLAQQKYANIPPKNSPEIAAIMAEQGVGRKQAYTIHRQQKLVALNGVEVPQTQRVQVLGSLIAHGGQLKNAPLLLETLHAEGVKIDMHDVVKTLWSLQKNGFVRFRERNNPPSLYAIKVTDAGFDAYGDMKDRLAQEQRDARFVAASILVEADERAAALASTTVEVPWEPIPAEAVFDVNPIIEEALAAEQHGAVVTAGKISVVNATPDAPQEVYNVSIVDYDTLPLVKSIRDRARKESVLAQAAKLLEEAGEDDIAVLIMERTDFSPLELEVKTMLAAIGDI